MRIVIAAGFCAAVLSAAAARAQQSSPSAELIDGIAAYNHGDFASAARLLTITSSRGEAEAMVNLGYMYARGHGVRRDPTYALQLYRLAANAGDGEGMNAVGYRYNFASKPDYERAIEWYCRAIDRGNSRAMNNLAILFYQGQGVPENRTEARSLWSQASKRGDLNAQADLGQDLISDPALSETEHRTAIEMLRDAAQKGNEAAQNFLRNHGDKEEFPPASDTGLLMRLEPRHPTPGHSQACGDLVS